jgi:hypothetical protein
VPKKKIFFFFFSLSCFFTDQKRHYGLRLQSPGYGRHTRLGWRRDGKLAATQMEIFENKAGMAFDLNVWLNIHSPLNLFSLLRWVALDDHAPYRCDHCDCLSRIGASAR